MNICLSWVLTLVLIWAAQPSCLSLVQLSKPETVPKPRDLSELEVELTLDGLKDKR